MAEHSRLLKLLERLDLSAWTSNETAGSAGLSSEKSELWVTASICFDRSLMVTFDVPEVTVSTFGGELGFFKDQTDMEAWKAHVRSWTHEDLARMLVAGIERETWKLEREATRLQLLRMGWGNIFDLCFAEIPERPLDCQMDCAWVSRRTGEVIGREGPAAELFYGGFTPYMGPPSSDRLADLRIGSGPHSYWLELDDGVLDIHDGTLEVCGRGRHSRSPGCSPLDTYDAVNAALVRELREIQQGLVRRLLDERFPVSGPPHWVDSMSPADLSGHLDVLNVFLGGNK